MVTKNKGIDLGETGMRELSVKKREEIEKVQMQSIEKMCDDALSRLKKITKTNSGEPEYISFPISRILEEYGYSGNDKTIKTLLSYFLRGSKNIVTKLGEADNRVVPDNMKPFAYSYVSEDKKRAMGLDAYCMKTLTKEMGQYIEEKAAKAKVTSDIYDLLLICDYLTAHGAHKQWVKLMGLKLSADLGQPVVKTKQALEDLIQANILLTAQIKRTTRGKDTICHLAYSLKDYSIYNNQLLSGVAADEYNSLHGKDLVINNAMVARNIETMSDEKIKDDAKAIAEKIQTGTRENGLGLFTQKELTDKFNSDNIVDATQQEGLSADDIRCLNYIRQRMLQSSDNKTSSDEEAKLKKTVERLQNLLSSLQEENTGLRKELAKAESETNKLKHSLEIQGEFNQAYAKEARKAMNQLISGVSSTTEQFTKIPLKRVTPDDVAEFKSSIISAATEANNRLRDFTYSKKVESLRK